MKHYLPLFILFAVCALLLLGCDLIKGYKISSIGNGYHSFVLKKGIGHFSLEYPGKYEIDKVETRNDQYTYTDVGFSDWDHKTEIQVTSFVIFIDHEEAVSNAEAMLNDNITTFSKQAEYDLIDLSSITVSGIDAKQYSFSYKTPAFQAVEARSVTPPCTWMEKNVYFDYGGVVWSIHMQSPVLNGNSEISDFEHIIQTFKVLN